MVVAIWAFSLWGASSALFAGEPPRTLAMAGVENRIDRPEWKDQLVGYGVSHLVLQGLYDTGCFVPIEQNPEVAEKAKKLIALTWAGEATPYTPGALDGAACELSAQAVAFARTLDFSVCRSRGFAGPFSAAKTTVTVTVEVGVKEPGKPEIVAQGKGSGQTRSVGAFFQIREDKIYFDETTVGKATQKAVAEAVEKLGLSCK
ncbi:MAG: hypothetical protein AB1921_11290 [Thermodesulfobacteriota bacterium]